jgi:hypothetical protein
MVVVLSDSGAAQAASHSNKAPIYYLLLLINDARRRPYPRRRLGPGGWSSVWLPLNVVE